MSATNSAAELFFTRAGLARGRVERIVGDALSGADDGELFLEYNQSESFSFDDGRLKSASFDTSQGFGLRAVSGEQTGYAHSSELSEASLKRAAATVKAVRAGHGGVMADAPPGTNRLLYADANPLAFIVEQAGGSATDGKQRILDIAPTDLHQRTPLFIGSKAMVEKAMKV